MTPKTSRTLEEACRCGAIWAISDSRSGYSLDLPEDDFVKRYEEFRHECPHHSKASHAAFCQRCDNSFPSEIGGANFLRKKGIIETNPFEEFPEPLKPREGPKVSPALWESLGSFIPRVPLVPRNPGAKIKELSEVTVLETDLMADTEATRALFREIMGMTSGGTAGGRGAMEIPDDIMDVMAGDAAQESIARNNLIMEMDRQDNSRHSGRYVSLDLMEMEADNVDAFLSSARKKIIKRSKPTRKACCAKIGGVLDQIMGAGGGDVDGVELQGVRDRGKDDPTGDVDQVAEAYDGENPLNKVGPNLRTKKGWDAREAAAKTSKGHQAQARFARLKAKRGLNGVDSDIGIPKESSDVDLFDFIAEEFFYFEHDQNCAFADPRGNSTGVMGESSARKRHGLLRDRYNLREGHMLAPLDKIKADLDRLSEQGELTGSDLRLFEHLNLFASSLDQNSSSSNYQEGTNMEPSQTALALSAFMEAKGSPDAGMLHRGDEAGDMSRKVRDDNKEYPTALTAVKSGSGKTAGALKPAKGAGGGHTPRYEKGADPIGEDTGISATAFALSNFMEATGQYASAKEKLALRTKDAGDLELSNREKQGYGLPLQKADSQRGGLDVYDDGGSKARFEKGANPIGGAVPSQQSARRMKK